MILGDIGLLNINITFAAALPTPEMQGVVNFVLN
jgi:hypothetical protein